MRGAQNENLTTALVSGENLAPVPRRCGYFRCGWRSVGFSCCCLLLLSFFFFLSVFSRRVATRISGRKRLVSSGKRCVAFSRAFKHATTRHVCGPQWHTVVKEKTWSSFKGKISSWNSNGNSDDDHRRPRRSLFIAFVLWAIRCARRWNNISWESSGKSFCNNAVVHRSGNVDRWKAREKKGKYFGLF